MTYCIIILFIVRSKRWAWLLH